jgi:hypothetical protein
VLAVDDGATLDISCPIALAVGLRVPERLDVDVFDAGLAYTAGVRVATAVLRWVCPGWWIRYDYGCAY